MRSCLLGFVISYSVWASPRFDFVDPPDRVYVFNISVTPEGLAIPFYFNDDVVFVELNSQHYSSSLRVDEVLRYPLLSEDPRDSPLGPHLSISHASLIGDLFGAALVIPTRQSGAFHLIAGGGLDPLEYCNTPILTANFRYPLKFHAKITLIPNPNISTVSPHILAAERTPSAFCAIDTSRHNNAITPEVYDALIEELLVLNGGELPLVDGRQNVNALNFTELMPFMPSIEFTIFQNGNGALPVGTIVLSPADYVMQRPDGSFELQVVRAEGLPDLEPQLGINFLTHVGIYINYSEFEIGFCDPL